MNELGGICDRADSRPDRQSSSADTDRRLSRTRPGCHEFVRNIGPCFIKRIVR